MRFWTRPRLTVVSVVACFLLCLSFVGTASAFSVRPHISVTPHHIVTDAFGCGIVHISGSGFTPSTGTFTNFAIERLSDSQGGTPSFGTHGSNVISFTIDSHGNFQGTVALCDASGVVPGNTFIISGNDFITQLANNSVAVRAD